jgi:hypothetical protein
MTGKDKPKLQHTPKPINTLYHGVVDATWKLESPDKEQFEEFCHALQRWAGVDANQPDTVFWSLRWALIAEAKPWVGHDWQADLDRLATLRGLAKKRQQAVYAIRKLLAANQGMPDRDAAWWIGQGLARQGLTGTAGEHWESGTEAVVNSLVFARDQLESRNSDSWQFGPMLFEKLPRTPPSPQTALAALFADTASRRLRDGRGFGQSRANRWRVVVAEDLPWAAFAKLIAATGLSEPQDGDELARGAKALRGRCWLTF